MSAEKKAHLDQAVTSIRKRWGQEALHTLSAAPSPNGQPTLPTGFPALDEALGTGGLPLGRIAEFVGTPTSGVGTLVLKIVASAQVTGSEVVYMDLGGTLDPDYARRCGVQVADLALIRPGDVRIGPSILADLVMSGGAGLIVFDSTGDADPQALSLALRRLSGALRDSSCVLLFLTALKTGRLNDPSSPTLLAPYTSQRLLVEKQRWLRKGGDIRGYEARVTVFKNKLAPPGRTALIEITFDDLVQGDST